MELPLLVIDIQRGGPSTGLPTKTEQGDLLQAMFGRHGETPVPIVAPSTPGDCFYAAIEATRGIAVKYRTPQVFLLSDGYIANGAEPWACPRRADSAASDTSACRSPPRPITSTMPATRSSGPTSGTPRPWPGPGPSLAPRASPIASAAWKRRTDPGTFPYDPVNHELMTKLRVAKVAGIAADIPLVEVDGDPGEAEVLVLGWGSTYGSIQAAVRRVRDRGHPVAHAHLRHLNPFPSNLGEVVRSYRQVLVPEMNLGSLECD